VTLDGTLLRIDQVAMTSGRARPYYSGKHKCHGVNVQVIADPAGQFDLASPALPGTRHDMGAAAEHSILDALNNAQGACGGRQRYQGAGATVQVPQRRRRLDRETGRYHRLSQNQKDVNAAHVRQRGPGERVDAQLKSWKILRRIRSYPTRATELVNAVQVLILTD
jgi:DDE superfamily endonuclease